MQLPHGHRAALVAAPDKVRSVCRWFEQQSKRRFCEIIEANIQAAGGVAIGCIGLFGMYMGHTLEECISLGIRILDQWDKCEDKSSMHRVTIELFTCERLVTQLSNFCEGGRGLHQFPDLCLFVFRYATLTVVGHFVEGRHRKISLHSSGASSHTVPGGQSALMRQDESMKLCQQNDFLNFASMAWRSHDALLKLLSPVCGASELKGLSYHRRVQKIYGSDVISQFRSVDDYAAVIIKWDKAHKRLQVHHGPPMLAIDGDMHHLFEDTIRG